MSVSDDLNAAADVLERDGWVQGSYHVTENGPHCAVGGLERGVGLTFDNGMYSSLTEIERDSMWKHKSRAQLALAEHLEIDASCIEDWNDTDGRTREEVIQAMRDAAIKNQPDAVRECPGGGGGG